MKLKKLIIKTGLYITLLAIGFLIGIYAAISTPDDSYYVKEINSSKMYAKGQCEREKKRMKRIKGYDEKIRKRFTAIDDKDSIDEACGKYTYLKFSHGQWTVTTRKEKPNRTIIVSDAAGNSIVFDNDKKLGKSIHISQKKRPLFVHVSDRNKDGHFEHLEYSSHAKNKYIGSFIDFNMDGQIDFRILDSPKKFSVYIDDKWHNIHETKINGKRISYIHYKGKRYKVDTRSYPFKLTLIDTK